MNWGCEAIIDTSLGRQCNIMKLNKLQRRSHKTWKGHGLRGCPSPLTVSLLQAFQGLQAATAHAISAGVEAGPEVWSKQLAYKQDQLQVIHLPNKCPMNELQLHWFLNLCHALFAGAYKHVYPFKKLGLARYGMSTRYDWLKIHTPYVWLSDRVNEEVGSPSL